MAISEIDDSVPITIPTPIPTPIPIPIPIPIPFSMAWPGRAAHGALPSGNSTIKISPIREIFCQIHSILPKKSLI